MPALDPPLRFADEPISVGIGRVAIKDGVAYSYTDSTLVATDLGTGSQRWSVDLPDAVHVVTGPMSQNNPPTPGIVTDEDDEALVIATYYRIVNGTGTHANADRIQAIAVDTNGQIRWKAELPSSSDVHAAGELHDSGGAAVVFRGNDTVVLDARTGAVRWTREGVAGATVDGDNVIGLRPPASGTGLWTTVAMRGADGHQLWVGPALEHGALVGRPPTLRGAGPGRAVVAGLADFASSTILLDTATGKPITSTPEKLDCLFDDRDTIVCWDFAGANELPELVVGIDANTGKQLWKLPDATAQRTSLHVSSAFHGAIYGRAANSAVVLDARTGQDLVPDASISPTYVVPGYGIVEYGTDEAMAYPARE